VANKNGIKENKIEIAKKLLSKNLSTDEIMEITGLTKEEIENIQK
jgi:predicted transposase/invertase (TIGR01784 family)